MILNYKTKIKKDDQVIVNRGKEKGKTGKVLQIDLKKGRVLVEGVNMIKKAVRKKTQNDRAGIIEIEGSLHISNVQLLARNGKPTRVRYEFKNEKKQRVSTKTGEVI